MDVVLGELLTPGSVLPVLLSYLFSYIVSQWRAGRADYAEGTEKIVRF